MSQKTARRRRTAARQAPPSAGQGLGIPRGWLYAGAALLAVVAAVAVVLASTLGGGGEETSLTVDGAPTRQLLDGIPQDGITLGSPEAPVVLVEFADFQCPFCAKAAAEVVPTIIEEYVRPGDVQLVLRGMAFIGPDSETALRTALAAGQQDRLWHVADLLFAHQGGENEGWVTEELLRAIGAAVPGLDVKAMLDARNSEPVAAELADAEAEASRAQVRGTPTFFVGKRGGTLTLVEYSELTPEPFREALDRALGR